MKPRVIGFVVSLALPVTALFAQSRTAADVRPGNEVNISYEYYQVRGKTVPRISESLRKNGPRSGDSVFYGTTTSQTGFTYRRVERGPYCRLENVGVRTDVVMLLPQWLHREQSPEEVQQAWDDFMDKLLAHEGEHYRIIERSSNQLFRALTGMRADDCAMLDSQAKATIEEISQQQVQLNQQFDESTTHGMNEGAVWPPSEYHQNP